MPLVSSSSATRIAGSLLKEKADKLDLEVVRKRREDYSPDDRHSSKVIRDQVDWLEQGHETDGTRNGTITFPESRRAMEGPRFRLVIHSDRLQEHLAVSK